MNSATIAATEGEANKTSKAIFGLREKGAITYYFDDGKAVVIRLDDLRKREIPALESVHARVVEDLHKERAEKAFNKLVNQTAAKAVETPLATLAKSIGASVEATGWLKPGDAAAFDTLKKKDIPVDSMAKLDHVGSIVSEIGLKNAFVVRLDVIESFDANTYQEKQQEVRKKLEHEYSMYFVEGFVASLYRNATIKTSESMANSAREDDYTPVEDYL